uniref:Uncharacterized protein n=1 Tax=Anopheles merus TaxID=30066 RepID=A0A182V583_ANOME
MKAGLRPGSAREGWRIRGKRTFSHLRTRKLATQSAQRAKRDDIAAATFLETSAYCVPTVCYDSAEEKRPVEEKRVCDVGLLVLLLLRPVLPGVTDEAAPAASGSSSSASLGQLGPGRLSVAHHVYPYLVEDLGNPKLL